MLPDVHVSTLHYQPLATAAVTQGMHSDRCIKLSLSKRTSLTVSATDEPDMVRLRLQLLSTKEGIEDTLLSTLQHQRPNWPLISHHRCLTSQLFLSGTRNRHQPVHQIILQRDTSPKDQTKRQLLHLHSQQEPVEDNAVDRLIYSSSL